MSSKLTISELEAKMQQAAENNEVTEYFRLKSQLNILLQKQQDKHSRKSFGVSYTPQQMRMIQ